MAETIHKIKSQRDEFMMRGLLKQMPLDAIDTSNVLDTSNQAYQIKLQFRRPNTAVTKLSDPWDRSCIVSELPVLVITHLNRLM
jgi:hypothetical protein